MLSRLARARRSDVSWESLEKTEHFSFIFGRPLVPGVERGGFLGRSC
jgi:hypothetical protein